jgi:hypothetical protein
VICPEVNKSKFMSFQVSLHEYNQNRDTNMSDDEELSVADEDLQPD